MAVVTGAVLALTAITPTAAQAAGPKQVVSGWLPWWTAAAGTQSIVNNADLFIDTSPFWFEANSADTIVVKAGATAAGLASTIATLHARGVKVVPSVTDAMAAATTAGIMNDPASRTRHVNALVALVDTYGVDGIDLDYEKIAFASNSTLAPQIRAGYVALLTELAARLHAKGKVLSVAVVAKSADDASPAHQAFDYAAIGQVVDRVRIMTYDQHSSGGAFPGGPISSVSWVDGIIQYAVSVIPAGKVEMGIPLYGYDWTDKAPGATTVNYSQALALMAQYGAQRIWSAQDAEPYFSYTAADGTHHTVWYNDAQAIASRVPLVAKYGLGGVAFWSLGAEDPGIWQALRNFTYGPNPFGFIDGVSAGPGAAQLRGWAIDANTTDPIRIDYYVDGHGVTSTMADTSRPDVGSLYFIYGDNHGLSATIPVGGGTHQACAYAINVGPGGNTLLGCRTVNIPTGSPVGSVDGVSAALGIAQVRGWTIDPDIAGPVRVDFYVDGHGAASMTADQARADIAGAYPLWGGAHGYSLSIPVPGGTHQLCAYAINVGPGGNTPSCRTVVMPTGNPFGSLDAVSAALGTAQIRGWAIDPDVADPVRVDFYVDGKGVTSMTADQSRPDVAGVYPGWGDGHGFGLTIPVPGGTHQVCAYAINAGPGGNTKLPCRTIVMPTGAPFGSLDPLSRTGDTLQLAGWAIDPDVADPIRVDFYVDGAGAASMTADQPRPDIGNIFPPYGPNHGFTLAVPVAPGAHQVCAYAINVAAGAASTKLGCRTG
jgi:spore germination protein YaaH